MMTIVLLVVTSIFTKVLSAGNSGYVPGYGTLYGLIPESVAAISIFIIVFGLFYDINKSPRLYKYQPPLFFAIIIRVFFVFFDRYGQGIYHLPNSGGDSGMYYRNAALLASMGEAKGGGTFSLVMGSIFKLTGVSQLFGQFVISLFSIAAIIMLIKIMDEIIDDVDIDIKIRTALIISLLPNCAIISSIFLRESIISMFLTCSGYFIVLWLKKHRSLDLIFAIAFALIASTFHGGSMAVVIAYVLLIFVFDKQQDRIHISLKNVPIAVILMGAVFFLFLNYGDLFFDKMTNVSSLGDVGSTYSEGGSTYAAYVGDSKTPLRMVIFTIPRLVYFLFSPFPWQWRGLNDIIAFVFSSLFYLYSIVLGIRAIKLAEAHERKYVFAFLIIVLCTAFVFSWGTTNTGTATRHREKMTVIYGILLGLGQSIRRRSIWDTNN